MCPINKNKLIILITLFAVFFSLEGILASERISGDTPAVKFVNEPILPIPLKVDKDPRIVALGLKLFTDSRLSADNSIACSTCHLLDHAGVDNKKVSPGIGGAVGLINTPTVYNSGMSFAQFWDGRAETLEEQAGFPIHATNEMGSNWAQVINKLSIDQQYKKLFSAVYPQGITAESIADAIATFERTLITPNSRFDQFLRGNESAITEEEKRGYILFKSYGCASCHQGVAIGSNMYEKMGGLNSYFDDRGNLTQVDYGRFNVTGLEEHKFKFKVPSLRNIALTEPYFHDGSAQNLEEAVKIMAKYQLGRSIKKEDIKVIVMFLQTLTGEFKQ